MAGRVEKAATTVNVPPAFKHNAFFVFLDEKELLKIIIGNIGKVYWPRDMGFACATKLKLRAFFFAIGAVDE